jgi:PelA/Pel-15E family pectate lyase
MTLRPRQAGESWFSESDGWSYIATIDNGSTVGQLLFLSRAFQARGDERYRDAFLRGLDYLFAAQFPNGCWPQVYPLQGGYHDAATFNDDAIVNVLRLFRDIGRDRHPFVPDDVRARAADRLARGVQCIVASQVRVGGRLTAWGQQHDPLTQVPVPARSYEPASLSGRESAGIAGLLMTLRDPDARVIRAVHAVADWFRKTAIHGYAYDFEEGLSRKEGAGPIWARMYEIGTDRPIFSNRDGIVLYDWNELTDRRTGYGWYGEEPAGALERYEAWSRRYPRIDDAPSRSR